MAGSGMPCSSSMLKSFDPLTGSMVIYTVDSEIIGLYTMNVEAAYLNLTSFV